MPGPLRSQGGSDDSDDDDDDEQLLCARHSAKCFLHVLSKPNHLILRGRYFILEETGSERLMDLSKATQPLRGRVWI